MSSRQPRPIDSYRTTTNNSAHPETSQLGAGLPAERLAYSVNEVARLTGLSRDLLYDEMRRGNLSYVKIGRRRVITHEHLQQFLGLPSKNREPDAIPVAGRRGAARCGDGGIPRHQRRRWLRGTRCPRRWTDDDLPGVGVGGSGEEPLAGDYDGASPRRWPTRETRFPGSANAAELGIDSARVVAQENSEGTLMMPTVTAAVVRDLDCVIAGHGKSR